MTSITISLSDEKLETIKEFATEIGVSTEEFLQLIIKNAFNSDDFLQASDYVLIKNAELYKLLS